MKKLKTLKGSTIQRDTKIGVGKRMGDCLYVHKNYTHLLDQDLYQAAKAYASQPFDIVKINTGQRRVSFIASPNWDSAPEPTVGASELVYPHSGSVLEYAERGMIYHHKWLFVGDDYSGFDVEESYERSRKWLSLPDVDMNRIGQKTYWEKEVIWRMNK